MGKMAQRGRQWLACAALAGMLFSGTSCAPSSRGRTPLENLTAALKDEDPAWKGHEHTKVAVRQLLAEMQKQAAPFKADFLVPLPPWNDDTHREADAAVNGTFTLQGVTGTVPRTANGGFDWTWGGPNHDPEFAWFLNRQHHLPALFVAWRETKEARYRTALNAQLRDWLAQNPRPGHYSFSSSWRALEVARRVEEAWMPVLLAPEAAAALDDDVLAGVLADLPEHAIALRDTHSFSGNHLITEMTGLAAIALAFPEFKDSPQWLDYAIAHTRAEAEREIYPDGAETELSNLYQQVVLRELQRLLDMLEAAGWQKDAGALSRLTENGWNFYAHTLDPRGHGPLDNDSSVGDDAALVREMAAKYQRKDWLYIATAGREGDAPAEGPSEYFPYAGLAVMRSGWEANAQWAFFDLGPRGSDHQHDDRLHLSIGGLGREFLVDDGRYNYQPGPWREYFTGPRGHNVVLLDGKGTLPPPDTVSTPAKVRQELKPDAVVFAATAAFAGCTVNGQGPAYVTRRVDYHAGKYWVVTDEIRCAGPHQVETLWHFHPDCTVQVDGDLIYTNDAGKANLGMRLLEAPAGGGKFALIRGREKPAPQGWYSASFNERVPGTCVSFTEAVGGPVTRTWVIWITPPGQDPRREAPAVAPEQGRG